VENTTADPMVGRLLDGRYQIRSRIARGGMATVYLATDLRLERRVAVKVMHGHLADDAAFRERFIREARSAARLAHPNVVAVFDQGEDSEMAYLVMEYLPGITLRELLQEHRVLTTEQTLDIIEAVLGGLSAAHRAGIVHRDLKPENVLLADDGRIKIGDFGLARAVSANTATGAALLGTIAYLSPELVTRGIADARSDIYAVGIMMYEMLTGEQPYKGEQPVQIAYQHANSTVPPPSARNPRVPAELDEIVQWATARSPEDRPADARALLDQVLDAHASLATALPGTGADTGQRTQVLPGVGTGIGRRLETGETTVLSPGPITAETTVLGGRRAQTAAAARISPNTEALAVRSRRRKGRGWWLLALVLTVALAGGATGWWFGIGPGAQAQVPDGLAGLDPDLAASTITEAGFAVGSRVPQNSVEIDAGLVIGTDPAGGTMQRKGTTIDIIVSSGPAMVTSPSALIGKPYDPADPALAEFVLPDAPTKQFDPAAPGGTLLGMWVTQDVTLPDGTVLVAAGTSIADVAELPQRTPLTVVVSAGPLPTVAAGTAPDVARQQLEAAGLTVSGDAVHQFSDTVLKDLVIGFQPTTSPVHVGDAVQLIVSDGPELFPVPDVKDETVAKATADLENAGFQVPDTGLSDSAKERWKVGATDPKAGEMLPKGSWVTLENLHI